MDTESGKSYRPWPENDKPAPFHQIAEPILESIRFAYILRRRNRGLDIPYSGFDIGEGAKVTSLSPHEKLTAEMLADSEQDQGRDALEELLGLAVQLGIEQGRRIEKERVNGWLESDLGFIRVFMDKIKSSIANLPEYQRQEIEFAMKSIEEELLHIYDKTGIKNRFTTEN